jgi:hypothetical protein
MDPAITCGFRPSGILLGDSPRYPQLNAILDENWRELMMQSGKGRRLPRARE